MFIVVRYGDDKREIFNPNCRNHILLENIKTRCACQNEDVVELSDETGMLKNIRTNPSDYGTTYFNNRETLVLVRVENEDPGGKPTFVPLLSGFQEDMDFVANLNPSKTSPSERSLSRTNSRTRKTSVNSDTTGGTGAGGRRSSLTRRASFHRQKSNQQIQGPKKKISRA